MFENEYTMSKKLTREYVNRALTIKPAIIGLFFAVIAFLDVLFLENEESRIIIGAIGIYMLAYPFIVNTKMVRNLEKSSKLLNDGKREKTQVIFNDNNIVLNEGKVHFELSYDRMKKVIQSKHFIIIKTEAGGAVLVHKEGFVKGDKEAFLEFIAKKVQKK